MKRLTARDGIFQRSLLFIALLTLLSPSWEVYGGQDDLREGMAACLSLKDDKARLKCFDDLAGKRAPAAGAAAETPAPVYAKKAEEKKEGEGVQPTASVMSRHWDLDEASRKNRSIIRPYRPNYFLPVAYNSSLNQDMALDVDPQARAQHLEAKFQLSFKIDLWPDILPGIADLWFGYTQLAFWQLYNSAFSSPFREINYEPELLLNFRTNYDVPGIDGLKGRFINLGLNHQSNGRANPLSRSWNRAVANFGFEDRKGDFNFLVKTWYRIPENASDDDNRDITAYMGYGELWGTYYWRKNRFAAMVRNNLRADNRGAVQLDWSFPIPPIHDDRFSGYIQYFNGYGESLIDYNKSVNRISIGFMLSDWNR